MGIERASGTIADAVERDGYAVLRDAVAARDIDALLSELDGAARVAAVRGGARHLLRDVPAVRALARAPAVRDAAETILGPGCFAVRALLFDKTAAANWKVAWHQDVTIALRARVDTPAYGPWSVKEGVVHVQPPDAVLERMVAVRVHLDDCGPQNGPLRVLPGSHRHGKLDSAGLATWRSMPQQACPVPRGGLLVMHPLLLHASSAAEAAAHRRVVHIEYASVELPHGLEWFDRV